MSERVYQAIKLRLQAGEFRLRERLDVAKLGAAVGASSTPVREALVRLTAERLISTRPARGFFVSLWSETDLKALYQWRGTLLHLAAETARRVEAKSGENGDYAANAAGLFQAIEAEANLELRRAGENADDRLHAARVVEPDLFADAHEELSALVLAAQSGVRAQLQSVLSAYHARRAGAARALRERVALRALPPNGV